MHSAIVDVRIEAADLLRRVASSGNGAVVLFLGTVREENDGRAVTGMEYSAYRSMAERELASIVQEAAQRMASDDIAVEHRVGELQVGECSVAVAAAHPHRELAFDGARYVVEELKRRVPIWKREHYADGSREWVRATSGDRHVPSASDAALIDAGEQG
jgi:molybdopterin synthase catalytic subunit